MKLAAIALDYDGTITRSDTLDPSMREAIAAARASGIVVLLVTGRILDELRRVAGDLHFVDAVVAENGAVLHVPDSGHTTMLAPGIPPAFVAEVRRLGLHVQEGQCLIDAAAADGPRLLEVIRDFEWPLVLIFNHGRVMTLPQGVSKATGLHAALDMLRISARNTVAIGDAENDHELLRIAEVGAAVEWGSPTLRAAADLIVSGSGPSAVAEYVRLLAATGRLPVPLRARRQLRLGLTEDGREFSLAVRGRNVLVSGDARSGKSWVAGLLCEQLILFGYCVCIIDPEGDYRSLEALPGVSVVGGEDAPPTPRELLRALRYPDRSLVIDLSRQSHAEKVGYVRTLLPTLRAMRERTGLPHRILIDEAHYFLHGDDAESLLDLDGNGYTVVTYRASRLPEALLARTAVMIVTCESDPVELDALYRRCAPCQAGGREPWSMISRLEPGQAVALPVTDEARGELRRFTLGPRLTPHVRHREKYVDVPVSEPLAFVFGGAVGGAPRRARTLRTFVEWVETLPPAQLEPYIRRGDFSRWIADVFGDRPLAADLHVLESRHVLAPRAETIPDIAATIRSRYDLIDRTPA